MEGREGSRNDKVLSVHFQTEVEGAQDSSLWREPA